MLIGFLIALVLLPKAIKAQTAAEPCRALQFNRIEKGYLSIPAVTFPGDFSLQFWILLPSQGSNLDGPLGFGAVTPPASPLAAYMPCVNFYQNRCRLFVNLPQWDVIIANTPNTPTTWVHYTITRKLNPSGTTSTLTMYLNGVLDAQVLNSTYIAPLTFDRIGQPAEGFTQGIIDEVRLWQRCLSDLEVAQGVQSQMIFASYGLTGYYGFNEPSSATTARDYSSTGANGTFVNMSLANWTLTQPINGCSGLVAQCSCIFLR
jgi:hypothetical protein